MKKGYAIGLDLGVSSVGWSILNLEKNKLEDYGVRLYPQSKKAEDRRKSRAARRLLKRSKTRVEDLFNLFKENNIKVAVVPDSNLLFKRIKGLSNKIDIQDIINILSFFMKNRGYIHYDGDNDDVEIIELNGKLPCQYYCEVFKENNKFRAMNKTVTAKDNEREIIVILNKQKEFYTFITEKFINDILKIFNRKRKFWEGPGGGKNMVISPYGRFKMPEDVEDYVEKKLKNESYEKYLFEDLIGKCEIKPDEKVVSRWNYYAEYFNFLNDFLNIKIDNIELVADKDLLEEESKSYILNMQGINKFKDYILNNKSIKIDKMFKDVLGTKIENVVGLKKNNKGYIISRFEYYKYIIDQFKKASLDDEWTNNIRLYNKVIYYLTIAPGKIELEKFIKNDDEIDYEFNKEQIQALADIKRKKSTDFKYHKLSESILKKAIKDMEKLNLNFMKVRMLKDYDKEAREKFLNLYNKNNKLEISLSFVDEIIASPQVKKTLKQAIRIINQIIKNKKELPQVIAVESTKEMNSDEKRKTIEKEQAKRKTLKDNAENFLKQHGIDKINDDLILRVMLYNEVNGMCPYCWKPLDINEVLNGIIEIEHILPLSSSYDDSYDNKTLAHKDCNKDKGIKTPYEYLNLTKVSYEEFTKRIKNLKLSEAKTNNFLTTENVNKYAIKFINRNLRDTSYATKELINQIQKFNIYLKYLEKDQVKTISTPGQLTSKIRNKLSLEKDRSVDNFHHAVDAAIISKIVTTDIGELVMKIQNDKLFLLKNKNLIENRYKLLKNVTLDNFLEVKNINKENTKISVAVQKKVNQQLFNANVYKLIEKEGKYYKVEQISNIYQLTEKDFSKLEKLFDENDKTLTLMCYDNNKNLYDKLKKIYYQFKNDKGNPFVNYVIEKEALDNFNSIDGIKHGIRNSEKSNSPFIVRLRFYSIINYPVLLNKKSINKKEKTLLSVDSLNQAFVEVYVDNDSKKFIFLPIPSMILNLETKQVNKKHYLYQELYQRYLEGKNTKFLTRLYNNNVIEVCKNNGQKLKGLFVGFHKASASCTIKSLKDLSEQIGYFSKGDDSLTIYDTDILGNEKRRLTYSFEDDMILM